jgi:AcrR family transcriptional regulator
MLLLLSDAVYRQAVYIRHHVYTLCQVNAYRSRKRAPAASRAKVLTAVHELLAAGEFHASTVEDVAERAGVSRATVYQQFGSRVGLVDALCETFDANPALLALRAAIDELAPLDALDAFVGNAADFWSSEERVLLQLYGVAAIDPAAEALVARQRSDRRRELERLLRRVRPTDPKRALVLLLVLTSFETYEELRRHAGLPHREVVRTLCELARAAV